MLLNAGCEGHSNMSLQLAHTPAAQGCKTAVSIISNVQCGQQAFCYFGESYRPDMFCSCGESLDPKTNIDRTSAQHIALLDQFLPLGFNPKILICFARI